MRKVEILALLLILLGGFLVRLYKFNNPIADWHSFRQSDTNAVSVIYVRDGINLLYPRYFDISNVQSGRDNPQGYRFVEFPIYNALQAGLFGIWGRLGGLGITLEQWGRLISIFATLASAVFTFLLTKKYGGVAAGFFASFFYLFLPFSIFYGRAILPDPAMSASILGGIYFFDRWLERISKIHIKYQIFFALSVLFTACAFLLKPFALFFTLPMVYLAWRQFGFSFIKKWQVWLFAALTLAPLLAWRWWIGQYPEGIPASDWLFNGNGIRFRPAFFRWIFFERVTRLILGYAGVVFLIVGGIRGVEGKPFDNASGKTGFFLSFAASSLLYLSVVATGNVQHDYYQILVIPTISMFGGLGVVGVFGLLSRGARSGFARKKINTVFAGIVCAVLIVGSLLLSWLQVRDYFNINDRKMVEAGLKANEILPKEAKVIAPHDGSTTFLNLIQRRGWPVFQSPIEDLIDKGATHLAISSPTKSDFEGFGKKYIHVASSSSYLMLKLK